MSLVEDVTAAPEPMTLGPGDDHVLARLRDLARTASARVAMRFKERGLWHDLTWREFEEIVSELALGFRALGLGPGDRVVVVGDASPAWATSLLGVQATGAIPVSLYQSLGPTEIAAVLADVDARMLVVDGLDWVTLLAERGAELPSTIVVTAEQIGAWEGGEAIAASAVRAEGRAVREGRAGAWEAMVAERTSREPALALTTAGSSGVPKVVVHSSHSLLSSTRALLAGTGGRAIGAQDSLVTELPSGHLGAFVVGVLVPMLSGAVAHMPEQLVADAIAEVRPTVSVSAGHFWEREAALVSVTASSSRGLRRLAFRLAERSTRHERSGGRRPLRLLSTLAYAAVFLPLLRKLGMDRLRRAYVLGSVSRETLAHWRGWGVALDEIYWTVEGGLPLGFRRAGVLDAVGAVELRTDAEGRLLARGSSVALGTLGVSEVEPLVDAEGWLVTGDVAVRRGEAIDLVGRAAELVHGSTGEPVSLEGIESALRSSPYFRAAIASQDVDGEIVALVDLDMEPIQRWASAAGVSYRSPASLRESEEIAELIRVETDRANARLSARGLPRVAASVPSADRLAVGRELTPTWSVRRYRRPADAPRELTRSASDAS